ncbi:MAG: hypothetical protein ACLKAN_12910 [Alkaliphilus sp.]
MLNLMKLEFDKIKYPYFLFLLLSILGSGLLIILHIEGYRYDHNIEIWDNTGDILGVFFPLIIVLPTCWLMYYERKNNFLAYTLSRVSKKKYLLSKWLTSSLLGALLVFLASFVGLIVALYIVPHIQLSPYGCPDRALRMFAGYYFVNEPLLYGLVLSIWRAVIGFIVTTFAFTLSLYVNNLFVILTGPFVYVMLENFILAILGVPYYRLVTSFLPTTLTPAAITLERLLVGPSILLFFIMITIVYFALIKKEKIYII